MSLAVEIPSGNRMKSIDSYHYPSSPSLTTDTSSVTNLTPPPAIMSHQKLYSLHHTSPLTFENLSKVQLADPSSMPLARYCNELEKTPYYSESVHSTTPTRKRRPHEKDHVIESPRLLPFPYHNDSYFLPTAEHDHPGTVTDASSSHVSLHTFGSRQYVRVTERKPSYPSIQQHTTLVKPSSLRDVMVPQQKKLALKFNLSQTEKQSAKCPWYKKLWNFFRSGKKKSKNIEKVEPVWYSQFRCNPPPPAGMKPF